MRITKRAASALERGYLWDDAVPGLGLFSRGRGKAWILRYRDAEGKRRQITLGHWPAISIDDARALARRRAGEAAHGRDPLAELRSATVADLLNHYEKHHRTRVHGRAPRDDGDTARRLDLLRERWGPLRAGEIRYTHVAELLASQSAAPYAQNRTRALIRSVWNRGRVWGLVPATQPNPVQGTTANPERPRTRRALSPAELSRIIDATRSIGTRAAAAIALVVYTGARPRELLRLRWEDTDLAATTITLRGRKAGDDLVLPLPADAVILLFDLERKRAGPWVFPGRQGKPWSRWALRKAWAAVSKAADLPEGTRLYDVRGAVATMIERELGLKAAQMHLGHTDSRTTLRYVRPGDSVRRDSAAAIGRALKQR